MDSKIVEIFIPGPAGRLEAKYYKSKKSTSPIALVLHPHPQYGGTMNNKVVVDTFHVFMVSRAEEPKGRTVWVVFHPKIPKWDFDRSSNK